MRTCVAVLIMTMGLFGCKKREFSIEDCNNMLTKEKIISLAKEVVKSQDFSLEYMEIYYDDANKKWSETLKKLKKENRGFARQYIKLLHNRCFQAVLFIPDITETMSGEFWVFVDTETGEIITFCGGL